MTNTTLCDEEDDATPAAESCCDRPSMRVNLLFLPSPTLAAAAAAPAPQLLFLLLLLLLLFSHWRKLSVNAATSSSVSRVCEEKKEQEEEKGRCMMCVFVMCGVYV